MRIKDTREGKSFGIGIDKSVDPSGNGYNTDYKYFDLCPQCMCDLICLLLESLDYDYRKDILNKFLKEVK